MKAIRTKYYGPTDTKSAHIKASDGDGNYILFCDFNRSGISSLDHLQTASLLCEKMDWKGRIAGGSYKDSWYWVFVD